MLNAKAQVVAVCLAAFPMLQARGDAVVKSHDVQPVEHHTTLYEVISADTATVEFAKGSSILLPTERDKLRALVNATKRGPGIDRYVVAAWSDQETPDRHRRLSRADRKLAETRGDAVRAAIEEMKAGKVEAYSMAKGTSWIAQVFNSDEAKIKGTSRRKNGNDGLVDEIGHKLRGSGGPGKVVVVVKYKNEVSAH